MASANSISAVSESRMRIQAAFLRRSFKNHNETVQRIVNALSDAELLAEHDRHQELRCENISPVMG